MADQSQTTKPWRGIFAVSGFVIAVGFVCLFGYGLVYGAVADACRFSTCPMPWLTAFDVWLVAAMGGGVAVMFCFFVIEATRSH